MCLIAANMFQNLTVPLMIVINHFSIYKYFTYMIYNTLGNGDALTGLPILRVPPFGKAILTKSYLRCIRC